MWRAFPVHLYAYVVSCIGVVVSEREQFVYPIVHETLPDWVVLPMLGWGVGVAWHGLAVPWQRLRARPNGVMSRLPW
jgi:2TM domain